MLPATRQKVATMSSSSSSLSFCLLLLLLLGLQRTASSLKFSSSSRFLDCCTTTTRIGTRRRRGVVPLLQPAGSNRLFTGTLRRRRRRRRRIQQRCSSTGLFCLLDEERCVHQDESPTISMLEKQAVPVTNFWPSSRNDGTFLAYQHLRCWNDDDDDDNDNDDTADDDTDEQLCGGDADGDDEDHRHNKNEKMQKQITIVYLPGYNSQMIGTKSNHIWTWCCSNKCNMLRFDYTGHGQSNGSRSLQDYGISTWLDDCIWMIESLVLKRCNGDTNDDTHDTDGVDPKKHSIVLVGASMGGWLAMLLLLSLANTTRTINRLPIHGILTIAAAPDFTEYIWNTRLTQQQRQEMQNVGHVDLLSRYQKEPYRYSHQLILHGREHLLLSAPSSESIDARVPSPSSLLSSLPVVDFPIILMHGTCDEDIPYSYSERLFYIFTNNEKNNTNVHLHLVAGGDHRLSDDHHLDLIAMHLDYIVRQASIRGR